MIKKGFRRIGYLSQTAGTTGRKMSRLICAASNRLICLTRSMAVDTVRAMATVRECHAGFADTDIPENVLDNILSMTQQLREQKFARLVSHNRQGRP